MAAAHSVTVSVFLWSICLCFAIAVACGCDSINNSADHGNAKHKATGIDLVEGLASKNEQPQIAEASLGSSKISLSPSYDKAEQQRVYECYKALLNGEAKSFPAFVAHLNDARYSQTGLEFGEERVLRSYSVGVACKFALQLQLDRPYLNLIQVHGPRDYFDRFSYVQNIVGTGDAAHAWVARHGDRSLAELQCEAIEWFLSATNRFGETGPTAKEVDDIKSLLLTIRQMKRPIRVDDPTMEPRYCSIYENQPVDTSTK